MKKGFLFSLVLALSACSASDDDIQSKTEWGNLQGISQTENGNAPSSSQIISKDGIDFFCVVSSTNSNLRTWILLHPNSPPYYKQMPVGNYTISEEDYNKIKVSGLASSTVLEVLSSHIKK